jgi:hypothetical protein
MLSPESLAKLNAGDLRDGVPFVCGFEWRGQKIFFLQGLRRQLGIDAGTAEEKQLPHTVFVGAVNQVVLDGQVLVEKINGLPAVGQDSAHFRSSNENEFRLFAAVEFPDCGNIQQVQFSSRPPNQTRETTRLKVPPKGAPYQTAVASHENSSIVCQSHSRDFSGQEFQQQAGSGFAPSTNRRRRQWVKRQDAASLSPRHFGAAFAVVFEKVGVGLDHQFH